MRIETAPRPGVTLVEVLVAIFVMALGLMALLTLFPLGALNMAQAIKDDRTGNGSKNGDAIARIGWKLAVESGNVVATEPTLMQAMTNPAPGVLPDRTGVQSASYPAFIDPRGYQEYTAYPSSRDWLAGATGLVPRRVTLNSLANAGAFSNALTTTYFTSGDDIYLDANGQAPLVQRDRRYSWAFMVRMPRAAKTDLVELTVVVYSARTPIAPLSGEMAYNANFVAGSTTATVSWTAGQEPPAIRRSGWIMDATMTSNPPRGYFYRVINVTDLNTSPPSMELELQTPARAGAVGEVSQALVLENVVEVFEKGTMSQ